MVITEYLKFHCNVRPFYWQENFALDFRKPNIVVLHDLRAFKHTSVQFSLTLVGLCFHWLNKSVTLGQQGHSTLFYQTYLGMEKIVTVSGETSGTCLFAKHELRPSGHFLLHQ